MRLFPPGHMNDTRRMNRGDYDKQAPHTDDCPDWYRDVHGADADGLWIMGLTDIGDK